MEFCINLYIFFRLLICQLLMKIDVQIIYRLVNCAAVGCILDGRRSTTGVPMSLQRRSLTAQQHTQQPVTTPPRLQSITAQLIMSRTTTPKPRSITLPRVTPPSHRSTTRLRMLPRITTQRLPLRTMLDRNITLRLQLTTLHPTLLLDSTPKPLSTTAKRPNITQPRTLPQFTTPRNLSTLLPRHPSIIPLLTLLRPTTPKLRSITLLRVTTPLRHLNITPQPTVLQLTTREIQNTRAEIPVLLIYSDL